MKKNIEIVEKIKFNINGKEIELSLDEAESLFNVLKKFFDKPEKEIIREKEYIPYPFVYPQINPYPYIYITTPDTGDASPYPYTVWCTNEHQPLLDNSSISTGISEGSFTVDI